ncbi:MAG TPA: hypothetical protein VG186_17920 [Solirubrobacteraceae bacterium]|nr:hypothetical protein [Solirubrobacteraceae bacterium]
MKVNTFGPVDERSLKQFDRCMEAGDAEYVVLCAGHPRTRTGAPPPRGPSAFLPERSRRAFMRVD